MARAISCSAASAFSAVGEAACFAPARDTVSKPAVSPSASAILTCSCSIVDLLDMQAIPGWIWLFRLILGAIELCDEPMVWCVEPRLNGGAHGLECCSWHATRPSVSLRTGN